MSEPKEYISASNRLIVWLLRSPLHALMSRNTLLITYQGNKSGKTYTTPVNYVRKDNNLYITSLASRKWWRNLAHGSRVNILLQKKVFSANAIVTQDSAAVRKHLMDFFTIAPSFTHFFHVRKMEDGSFNKDDILAASKDRIGILLTLAE
jgi:deazaflavin-dependent oxidoreductase (nitroreductase family)